MTRRWMGALFTVALVACSGGSRGGEPGQWGREGGQESEPVAMVEVTEVGRGDVVDWVVTHAVVESESQADLYANTTAQVLSVHADVGDQVRRGDLLAVLEAVVQGAGAERANADVAKAERDYAKLTTLHTNGAVSDQDLADAEHALATARSASREASFSYGKTRLVAPFDGVVSLREVRVGGVATSSNPAFQVVDLSRLRVVASLPEREVSRVSAGQPAKLVSAYDEDQVARGTVDRVAPVIDASTGTFRVTVVLDSDQTVLRPGQFVSTQLEVDRHIDVVVVPRKAVVYEDGDPVVYTMVLPEEENEEGDGDAVEEQPAWAQALASWFGSDEAEDPEEAEEDDAEDEVEYVAKRNLLELGLVDDDFAEVLGGVELGESVVVVGQSTLRDGTPLRIPGADADEVEEAAAADGSDGASGGSEG